MKKRTFKNYIKSVCSAKGILLQDVADALYLTWQGFNSRLNDAYHLRAADMSALSRILDVPIDELYDEFEKFIDWDVFNVEKFEEKYKKGGKNE